MKKIKPLLCRSYGSIPHLLGSNADGDKYVGEGQHRICTLKPRDKKDVISISEKLDGSNVSVAKINGELIPLIRAGYRATDSPRTQHQIFHQWVMQNYDRFDFLEEGERICGEWMMQAHGTLYKLEHIPFVPFDIMIDTQRSGVSIKGIPNRLNYETFNFRLPGWFPRPKLLHIGGPLSIEESLDLLGEFGFHGALERTEGVVYRVEREEKIDFLAKYIRRSPRCNGRYLKDEFGNQKEIWNMNPKEVLKNEGI